MILSVNWWIYCDFEVCECNLYTPFYTKPWHWLAGIQIFFTLLITYRKQRCICFMLFFYYLWITESFFCSGNWYFDFWVIWNCDWFIGIYVRFVYFSFTSSHLTDFRIWGLHLVYIYSENAGLLGLTRVGSRRVVQIAAGFMIFFSILGNIFFSS